MRPMLTNSQNRCGKDSSELLFGSTVALIEPGLSDPCNYFDQIPSRKLRKLLLNRRKPSRKRL
jgi:hypothetical protein